MGSISNISSNETSCDGGAVHLLVEQRLMDEGAQQSSSSKWSFELFVFGGDRKHRLVGRSRELTVSLYYPPHKPALCPSSSDLNLLSTLFSPHLSTRLIHSPQPIAKTPRCQYRFAWSHSYGTILRVRGDTGKQ